MIENNWLSILFGKSVYHWIKSEILLIKIRKFKQYAMLACKKKKKWVKCLDLLLLGDMCAQVICYSNGGLSYIELNNICFMDDWVESLF